MKKTEIIIGKIVEVTRKHIIIRYDGKNFTITGHFPQAATEVNLNLIKKTNNGFDYFVPSLEAFEEMGGQTSIMKATVTSLKKNFAILRLENGELVFWKNKKNMKRGLNVNFLVGKFSSGVHPYMLEL